MALPLGYEKSRALAEAIRKDPDPGRAAVNTAGLSTEAALAAGTFGATDKLKIGGKSVGQTAGNAVGSIIKGGSNFLKRFDTTVVGKTDQTGVNAAQAGVAGSGARAAGMASNLQNNPTQFRKVRAPDVGAASQIDMPAEVQAERIAAGQAEAMMVDPAQIAALERAQAAAIERGDEQGVRASQMALAQALEAQAAGTAPSLAEMQLQRQNEQAVRQQLALAGSQRGMTPAMAQRQAAMNISNLAAEQGARAAEIRIQEQQAARAQLADVLGQTRGLDVNLATQQAQLEQQAALQNASQFNQQATAQAGLTQQAALANQGEFGQTSRFNVGQALQADTANAANALQAGQFNVTASQNAQQFNAKAADEMTRFRADAGLRAQVANQAAQLQATGMDQAQIARLLGIEQSSLGAVLDSESKKMALEADRQKAMAEAKLGTFKTVGSVFEGIGKGAAGVVGMMSDKRQKKNIKAADAEMREFVDALSPNTYEYKDTSLEGTSPGKRYGIMAQALEKSRAGKSIVIDTKDGKKVDVAQGLGVALAALAAMNKRLGKVEGRRA
jgi:predicted XRE-type DNA-binding protein